MPNIKNVIAIARKSDRRRVEVRTRQYKTVFSQPPVGIGSGDGPTPHEYFLISFAGCIVSVGMILAAQRKLRIHSLEAVVDGDFDLDVLLGVDTKSRSGFSTIHVRLKIEADLTVSEKEDFVLEIQRRCPVADNLQNPTPVEYTVE
jgi:putative redox protein